MVTCHFTGSFLVSFGVVISEGTEPGSGFHLKNDFLISASINGGDIKQYLKQQETHSCYFVSFSGFISD